MTKKKYCKHCKDLIKKEKEKERVSETRKDILFVLILYPIVIFCYFIALLNLHANPQNDRSILYLPWLKNRFKGVK